MTFIWPVPGPITRGFGYLSSIYVGGQHAAIDVAAPSGTPIRAVAGGAVVGVGWDQLSGFFVAVDHADGWRSTYRHLYGQAPVVVGQSVAQNQIIGNVGNTGYSLGPHLHFDLWNKDKLDPTAFAKRDIWAHDPELYLGQGDDMNEEQWRLLQDTHHHVHALLPAEHAWISKQLKALETANHARYEALRDKIAAIDTGDGCGASPAEVLAMAKKALKEGGG